MRSLNPWLAILFLAAQRSQAAPYCETKVINPGRPIITRLVRPLRSLSELEALGVRLVNCSILDWEAHARVGGDPAVFPSLVRIVSVPTLAPKANESSMFSDPEMFTMLNELQSLGFELVIDRSNALGMGREFVDIEARLVGVQSDTRAETFSALWRRVEAAELSGLLDRRIKLLEAQRYLVGQGVTYRFMPYGAYAPLIVSNRGLPVPLLEIISLPRQKHHDDLGPVLGHAGLPRIWESLKAASVTLVWDPSLGEVKEKRSTMAWYSPGGRIFAIGPGTDWVTVKHEYEHFIFHEFLTATRGGFASLRVRAATMSGRQRRDLKKSNPYLARVLELIRQGYTELALDEKLAGEVTRIGLRENQIPRFSFAYVSALDYELSFYLSGFKEIKNPSLSQRTAYNLARTESAILKQCLAYLRYRKERTER